MYRYTLDKSSKKHLCPKCNKKRFVVYLDIEDGSILSKNVGRCDREVNCSYHLTPKEFFKNSKGIIYKPISSAKQEKKCMTSYHNSCTLDKSLKIEDENNLIKFLKNVFPSYQVENMIQLYKIGTATFWHNATIFWEIDGFGKIRGGKMIPYSINGKRSKYINWVHAYQIKTNQINAFNLEQCLFGLHLVHNNQNDIAIVESEKTACIMSMIFDKYLWLAAGSLNGINEAKLSAIKNRKIVLYPDAGISKSESNPYRLWKQKSSVLKKKGYDIKTSSLLEERASENEKRLGLDIADYFLKSLNQRIVIKNNEQHALEKLQGKHKELNMLVEVFDLELIKNVDFNVRKTL